MVETEEGVLVMMRTPMTSEAASGVLPATLTVRQAFEALKAGSSHSESARRVLVQLDREVSARQHDWLALNGNGGVTKTSPDTRLSDLAVNREVRTPAGPKTVPVVGLEAQSYAKVG
jgi:hypothetical protein